MEAKVSDLRILIQKVLRKSRQPATLKGFREVSEILDGKVGVRYLYKMNADIGRLDDSQTLSLRENLLSALAQYVEFDSYLAFSESLRCSDDPQLESFIGNYFSYVRMNADETVVLRSPARIVFEDDEYIMELKGARNVFRGKLESCKGCLFVLLSAADGKRIQHVYKIGSITSPSILQGVFSGVSSAFDPIGGRVVLQRSDESFQKMKIASLKRKDVSKNQESKVILEYFSEYSDNNLSIHAPTSFTASDLRKKM